MKYKKADYQSAIEDFETVSNGLHMITPSGVSVVNLKVKKDVCVCDVKLFIDDTMERHNGVEYLKSDLERMLEKRNEK